MNCRTPTRGATASVSNPTAFPPVPDASDAGAALERYKARLTAHQKVLDAELGALTAYTDALVEVAKGSIERARAGADVVQKAAAAIAGVYTTVLGVAFSVTENPFPSRGLTPLILLGLAIVLSTAYLAYLSRGRKSAGGFTPSGYPRENMILRVNAFVGWTRAIVRRRSYLLQASVVALALALPFLGAPFISIGKIETSAPTPMLAEWPDPPDLQDAALERIQFTAMIKEQADVRAKQLEAARGKTVVQDDSDEQWWTLLVGAVILTFVAPLLLALVGSLVGAFWGWFRAPKIVG